ncbi:MAG: hypothetical protein J0I41_14145 [Filimonas sp.]|nr:hypothetical protein [Filimonas sp.]
MLQISYYTGCRKCLKTEGIRSFYMVDGASLSDYKKQAEYQVMRQIENWRKEDGHLCPLCGSPNVELTDIQVDNYPLYNYENLVARNRITNEEMFMLNIDKREYGLDVNDGGKNYPDMDFINDCFLKLVETVSQISNDKFVPHKRGSFFICFTGNYNLETGKFNVTIERFRFHGVTKTDIANGVNKMLLRYGISDFSMIIESETSSETNLELDFIWKSSDHLRFENGKHVSGPHGGARRAVRVEPNSGGQGVIVTLYNLDGNHPVWQNNIQMAPKQMDVIQQTNNKIVLRGYGHDDMGGSFADYGLTIFHNDGNIEKCVLHMHDRGVDIEYLC